MGAQRALCRETCECLALAVLEGGRHESFGGYVEVRVAFTCGLGSKKNPLGILLADVS